MISQLISYTNIFDSVILLTLKFNNHDVVTYGYDCYIIYNLDGQHLDLVILTFYLMILSFISQILFFIS